jgi:hypothetical protein
MVDCLVGQEGKHLCCSKIHGQQRTCGHSRSTCIRTRLLDSAVFLHPVYQRSAPCICTSSLDSDCETSSQRVRVGVAEDLMESGSMDI